MNWLEILKYIVIIGATVLGINGVRVFNHQTPGVLVSTSTVCGQQLAVGEVVENTAR